MNQRRGVSVSGRRNTNDKKWSFYPLSESVLALMGTPAFRFKPVASYDYRVNEINRCGWSKESPLLDLYIFNIIPRNTYSREVNVEVITYLISQTVYVGFSNSIDTRSSRLLALNSTHNVKLLLSVFVNRSIVSERMLLS